MASGDSAIEITELSLYPEQVVAESPRSGRNDEPSEVDVFLPSTPVSNFNKIPARAHSTPRPKGSLTDSDECLQSQRHLSPSAPPLTANEALDQRYHDNAQASTSDTPNPKPIVPTCRRQFFFCLALFAMAVLIGFLAGYFVREKVFEREAVLKSGRADRNTRLAAAELREQFHQQGVGNISADRIADYASTFSQLQCVSGTPCSQTMSSTIAQQLRDLGFKVDVSSYNVLTSHPDMSHTSMLRTVDSDGNDVHTEVLYGSRKAEENEGNARRKRQSLDAEKDVVYSTSEETSVMYMPFSASGYVQGELVYVHYASQGDLLMLTGSNIELSGKIAIARQGTKMVADQVKNVQEHGMEGLLLYTDPADMDVMMTLGSQQLVGMTSMMGDPLTPGCPAMDGITRMSSIQSSLPDIPVQPVSSELARGLLGNMTGWLAPKNWQGGLDVTYYMGRRNTKKPTWTVKLNISNSQSQQPVHDVVATITGTQMPDEYIILGGHFPSMTPLMNIMGMTSMTLGQGSMSMFMEVATAMSDMMSSGWQPQRSVLLGLWGGAEYGHSGSMAWAAEHRSILSERAVSYLHLDTTMQDDKIQTQASPVLRGMIMKAAGMLELSEVVQPDMMSAPGDHVTFSQMLGVPSARLHAADGMARSSSGTPSMSSHKSVTQLAMQTTLMLADSDVIPFDASAMGEMLVGFVDSLESKMGDVLTLNNMTFDTLKMAVSDYRAAAKDMQSMIQSPSMMESSVTMTMVNHRLMYMERAFMTMDSSGSMTHILYGMTEMDTFPLIAEFPSMDIGNGTLNTMMERVSFIQCSIRSATLALKMDLS